MLDAATLNRVSNSYRRGYYDGYRAREHNNVVDPKTIMPFSDFDYGEGYRAGANDAKWENAAP